MYLDREAISVNEAKQRLSNLSCLPKIEKRLVKQSHDYVLAESIHAPFDYPSFRRSGYDGYGIRLEDDHDFPKVMKCVAEVGAGAVFSGHLQENEVIRIMTGAAVPDGVGKVIMLEQTKEMGNQQVEIQKTSRKSNISPVGEEFEAGELLLEKGTIINAGVISLLTAFGFEYCQCYRKTRVGILATGSELILAGTAMKPGCIYNSNSPMLSALVRANGGDVIFEEQIADDHNLLSAKLSEMAARCDLILTIGGVSVGDYDWLAVAAQENQCLFNKIAMRPGSTTTAFVYQETPVIALSGNPGACFIGFYLFAEPLIQRLSGKQSTVVSQIMCIGEDFTKKNNFDRYVRAQWREESVGKTVYPVGSSQSSALGNLHLADALIKIPAMTEVKKGTEVEVWCLPYR